MGEIKMGHGQNDPVQTWQDSVRTVPRYEEPVQKEVQDAAIGKYHQKASEVANLVTRKQEAYGDSFGKAHKILELFWPNGIPVHAYKDLLTIVRMLDKFFRIATRKDAFGESPWDDVLGYSLLAATRDKEDK